MLVALVDALGAERDAALEQAKAALRATDMTHERLRVLERLHAQGEPSARLLMLEELRRLERPLVDPRSGLELVYVPGGEVGKCPTCMPSSIHYLGRTGRSCPQCGGANVLRVAPFYLGRFPVTCREWKAFVEATDYHADGLGRRVLFTALDEHAHHPATNLSHEAARDYCSWAGFRLPLADEWRWAALGGEAQRVECDRCLPSWGDANDRLASALGQAPSPRHPCSKCGVSGRIPRHYPWGNERPSPGRCVWRGSHPIGLGMGETSPVVEWEHSCGARYYYATHACTVAGESRLVPARPGGASWCEAHDMAGNVWEWTEPDAGDPSSWVLGGSFRTDPMADPGQLARFEQDGRGVRDDVGFRVALSVTP